MKLCLSNLSWKKINSLKVFELLKDLRFSAIEIAPTKLLTNEPYTQLDYAKSFSRNLKAGFGLEIASLQSIFYGRDENIFGSKKEFNLLINLFKNIILFSSSIGSKTIVFGNPKNRIKYKNSDFLKAINFFIEVGKFAQKFDIQIAIEANPTIYNTNFLNYTNEVFEFVKLVNHNSVRVNLDLGTMIVNNESISSINDNFYLVNHVHISEPHLKTIRKRLLHLELSKFLKFKNYTGYVSLEMLETKSFYELKRSLIYFKDIFT